MKTTICDVCKQDTAGNGHYITIDLSADGFSSGKKLDLCEECYTNGIILSEMRRTRTRKRKPGRPRGRRTQSEPIGGQVAEMM